ncbi:MAG: hypothetical protein AAFY60_03225, partial [Myxococcota bacterium]
GTVVVYPGAVLTLLAVSGLVAGFRTHRRWVFGAALCAGGAFACATYVPAKYLFVHPLLHHREVFATVLHAFLVGLAAVAFARLEPVRLKGLRRLALVLLLIGVGEGVALPVAGVRPPSFGAQPWMAHLEPEMVAVAHVGEQGFGPSWQNVHDALVHRRAVLGGPSVLRPTDTDEAVRRLTDFPRGNSVLYLRSIGVGLLVVAKPWLSRTGSDPTAQPEANPGVTRVFEDANVVVYRLSPATVAEREALDQRE